MRFYLFFIRKTLLFRDKKRGNLVHSIIGIALSFTPMIMLFMIADSMIEGIVQRFIETGTYHMQLSSYLGQDETKVEKQLEEVKKNFSNVKDTFKEKNGFALAFSLQNSSSVNVRAIERKLLEDKNNFKQYFKIEGKFELKEKNSIVLGKEVAKRLNIKVGDNLRLLSSKKDGKLKISAFVLEGIVSTGYQELDKIWCFIPLESAENVFFDGEFNNVFGIKIDAPYSLPNEISRSKMDFEFYRKIKEFCAGFKLKTWYDMEIGRYSNFVESRNLIAVVIFVIIAVATINLASSMAMFAIERRFEVAVLRCLGFSKKDIASLFLLLSVFVGTIGILIGDIFGVMLSIFINEIIAGIEFIINSIFHFNLKILNPELYLEKIPVKIDAGIIVKYSVLAIILCMIASIVPALSFAKEDPISSIKRL